MAVENGNGYDEGIMPQYVDPQEEHRAAARKLDLSVEAINRARDPHLYTAKRHLTGSLSYRLANPHVPIEEIARITNLPIGALQEDLDSAHEAFQWAADILNVGNLKEQVKE